MAQFSVNPSRFDPYKNFKFRVKWDGRYVAGVCKVSALKRTTEVVKHREGGDPSSSRKSVGRTEYEPVTLERGVTHDLEFLKWANKVWNFGAGLGAEVSLKDFRKDVILEVYNEAGQLAIAYKLFRCWVSEYQSLPDLDANANAVAIEHIKLENEGWERDLEVVEPSEPSFSTRELMATASALLDLWEHAHGQPPAVRALDVLATLGGAFDPASLPVGERDRALLALHAEQFGTVIDAVATCPTCDEVLDVPVRLDELDLGGTAETQLAITLDGNDAVVRVPTAADLATAPTDGAALLDRCIVSMSADAGMSTEMRDAIEEALTAADPSAEITVGLCCPACETQWAEVFDPSKFIWAEVSRVVRHVVVDVRDLARAYGWSERELVEMSAERRRLYLDVLAEP